MSTRARKIAKMRNKQYRDAFVGSQIGIGLPFQIRALREHKGWKQSQLAEKTGMLQPRISAMETPGGARFTLETLRRLASAFDVGIMVRFVPFSALVDWSEQFSPDSFSVASFDEDAGLIDRKPLEQATVFAWNSLQRAEQRTLESAQHELPGHLTNLILRKGPKPQQALTEQSSQALAGCGAAGGMQ